MSLRGSMECNIHVSASSWLHGDRMAVSWFGAQTTCSPSVITSSFPWMKLATIRLSVNNLNDSVLFSPTLKELAQLVGHAVEAITRLQIPFPGRGMRL